MARLFRDELVQHWNVLLGSIIGIGCGAIALPVAAISIFMRDQQVDLGWSRTDLSIASMIVVVVLALSSPVVGWFADRYRTSNITAFSMFAMGGCFLLLSRVGDHLALYLGLFAATALLSAGVTTVPFARVVTINFVDNRGKALGLAMLGNGLSGFFLPLILVPLVAERGWRVGFVALAGVAIVAAPTVLVLLRINERRPADVKREEKSSTSTTAIGMTVREAIVSRPFKVLAIAFPLIAIAGAGMQLHFISILGDNGLSAQWVAWYASAIGIALTVSRVLTGYLLDTFNAQRVSATIMAIGAVATLIFAFAGTWGSIFGAIAIGLTVGAEIDMVGYFASKYFGFKSYGRVYGLLYSTILISTTISPLIYGAIRDRVGNYTPALIGTAVLLACSGIVLLALGRLPYLGSGTAQVEGSRAGLGVSTTIKGSL
ncbi:MFS transporter [Rhodococcus sp. WS3]|nr:oxalate/formate antiporter family transporter [Rhodococcus sp. AD45]ROZ42754.1 MFS transporter [Rhodococcus sp. WS3]